MYTKSTLKRNQKLELEKNLQEVLYVCGDSLADAECDDDSVLNVIHTKTNLSCNSPIEIPYYSAGNTPICFFVLPKKISRSKLSATLSVKHAMLVESALQREEHGSSNRRTNFQTSPPPIFLIKIYPEKHKIFNKNYF